MVPRLIGSIGPIAIHTSAWHNYMLDFSKDWHLGPIDGTQAKTYQMVILTMLTVEIHLQAEGTHLHLPQARQTKMRPV